MPIVKNYFREKVQGEKVKVANKNHDDRVHHLTEFGLRIQGKKIVPRKKKNMKNKMNIYTQK